MNELRLSKNFTLGEFLKSQVAIHLSIDNTPTHVEHLLNLMALVQYLLQPARDHLSAMTVTSGYRSMMLNEAIGGSQLSQHMQGKAADIQMAHGNNASFFYHVNGNQDFDQLIWEFGDEKQPDWVHVSYNGKHNRKEVLRAKKVNGITYYEKFK